MSVREYDGSDDITVLDNGIVTDFNNGGAHTLLCLIKPTALALGEAFIGVSRTVGGNAALSSIYDVGGGSASLGTDDPGSDSSAAVSLSASAWQILAVTAAGAGATPRLHRKVLGSGSWSHVNAGSALGTSTGTAAHFAISSFRGDASIGPKDMRIAMGAFFSSALSDGNIESIESTATTAFVESLGPAALWDFNQASTATSVLDLTGNGSDQTSQVGTTVIEGDDPAWTFGLGAPAAAPSLFVVGSPVEF